MVPHYSGTTLDAQARYAAGTKEILENYFTNKPQNPANLIVSGGTYATKACKSCLHVLMIQMNLQCIVYMQTGSVESFASNRLIYCFVSSLGPRLNVQQPHFLYYVLYPICEPQSTSIITFRSVSIHQAIFRLSSKMSICW